MSQKYDVSFLSQTYLPHSIKKIFFTQELCILFWKLFELNQVRELQVSLLPILLSCIPSPTVSLTHTITPSPFQKFLIHMLRSPTLFELVVPLLHQLLETRTNPGTSHSPFIIM